MNKNIILFAAMTALVCSCGPKSNDSAAVVEKKATKVAVITTEKTDVPQEATYSSTVQAYAINNIVSQAAGRIRSLNVEIGDYVEAGQILAEMDRLQLEQAALRLKNDETELERVKALYEQGGVSQADYEALELAFNISKRSYDNLLENTVLRAPISGVVTSRNYDKGDMYAMSSPIYTIQQISPVKLLVAISESDYTKVKKGDSVSITADALPGRTFSGKIVRLYPVMDASSHTFSAEVNVANNDRSLRPGMFARAVVNMGTNNSIVIPDSAIIKQQGSGDRGVFVLKNDGTVELRIVKLGRYFDSKYEILSGLEVGEKVVTQGNSALKAGDKVEVA